MKRLILVAVGVIVGLLVVTEIENAAGQENVIHGCISRFSGRMRVVKLPRQCKWWETPFTLNMNQLQGSAGLQGPPGPQGPAGPQGPSGEPGNMYLADQMCEDGEFVKGFDQNGDIVCAQVSADIGADCPGNLAPDADLHNCDLSGLDLMGANLSSTNLSGTNLSGTSLISADLTGADLTGADLTGADLTGADLQDAIVDVANLNSATLDFTYCPDGTLSNDHAGRTCEGDVMPN